MQLIHCTKKLLAELGAIGSKMPPEHAPGFLGPWHANLIRVERRKCILFTNDRTLYSFLVRGFRKKDDFHEMFLVSLNSNLAAEGLRQEDILKVLDEYREIAIAPTMSRSVLGSMNDLAGQVEFLIHRAGGLDKADMLRVNMMLNRVPMGALKYRFAVDKVLELFGRTDRIRKIGEDRTTEARHLLSGLHRRGTLLSAGRLRRDARVRGVSGDHHGPRP